MGGYRPPPGFGQDGAHLGTLQFAVLNGQQSPRGNELLCNARQHANGVEPVRSAVKGEGGVIQAHLGIARNGLLGNVGRIGDHHIERSREMAHDLRGIAQVAFYESDGISVALIVATCPLISLRALLYGPHLSVRSLGGDGERYGAGTRAEVNHARTRLTGRHHGVDHHLHQELGLGPRNKHSRTHGENKLPETGLSRDVLQGFARGPAADKLLKCLALTFGPGGISHDTCGQFPPAHTEHVSGQEEGIDFGGGNAYLGKLFGGRRERVAK